MKKRFGDELLFDDLNVEFESPSSTALLGINGSGKSTLLQMIATYVMPDKGNVTYRKNNQTLNDEEVFREVSFCSPYLELIEELSLTEFLHYHFSFKKKLLPIQEIIQRIGLHEAGDKRIEKFSSGMKQRVKLAQAIFADTSVLLLDEPCTNLDQQGIDLYTQLIRDYSRDRIVIVASNDEKEYKVCDSRFYVKS
ncbi:MAG: ABC transporter ATP-binding protein [Bacteroidetes bacterium]|nr:ABC transporter ATP-binding protein [Bacteroidota bacterium]